MTDVDRHAMLAEAREELERADSKASMLLSAIGVGVGVIVAGILASSWRPGDLPARWEGVWWGSSAVVGVATAVLTSAIYPRISIKRAVTQPTYFGDIEAFESVETMDTALKQVSEDQRVDQQLFVVSKIVSRKYLALSLSIWLFAIAFAGVLTAVIAGH